jgi:hypothetical protein
MDTTIKTKQAAPAKSGGRGRYPTKRSINLAPIGESHIKASIAIPAIILIIAAAALLSKFLVYDRIVAVNQAKSHVSSLRTELSQVKAEIDGYGDLADAYAHYTLSGMTLEELQRVDRNDIVDLIKRVALPRSRLENWSVTANQLTLGVTADTLQEINMLAQALNDEEMVNFSTVRNAATVVTRYAEDVEETKVTAQIIVYLNPEEGWA